MQSDQPNGHLDGDSDMSIGDELDVPLHIPEFALAWESLPHVATPIRRPSNPPDPDSYHRDVDPQAIFEFDEVQKDGSIKTILVVPPLCKRCRQIRQACSRARPACTRCRKAGQICKPVHEGYELLPGPKISKGSKARARSTDASTTDTSTPKAQESTTLRIRIPRAVYLRATSSAASSPQPPPLDPGPSVPTGSKRPLSPEQLPARSRKKTQTDTVSRKGKEKERYRTEEPSNTTNGSGALTWTFVDPSDEQDVSETQLDTISSFTPTPRVWTNSFSGLLNVFPQLDEAPTGLSWQQSETPLLLLEDTSANSHWISSSALCINMSWDFSCYSSDLESPVESELMETPQHLSPEPEAHSEEDDLENFTESSFYYENWTLMASFLHASSTSTPHDVLGQGGVHLFPENGSSSLNPVDIESSSISGSEGSLLDYAVTDRSYPAESTSSQADPQPNIPLVKPSEIEILLDSRLRDIPVLIWMSRNCNLAPRVPSPEYAYLCMGFFFISDLRHTVTNYAVCPTTGVVEGQVCWTIKLEWAPGGEEILFEDDMDTTPDEQLDAPASDTRRDRSHPWWIDVTDTSSAEGSASPYRPRDLRMQFSTYLPLDLLADFHPSEFFPRGWFCRACGIINMQKFFRHQICQSSICKPAPGEPTPQGKADPLSSLRDIYQSQILLHPTDDAPSVLKSSDTTKWSNGMQVITYGVKDNVTLYHVFTGNQESLQIDANALLEGIQRDVLMSREDPSGPYFVHTTKLTHATDGSGPTVPVGTPMCVRTAYYVLSEMVQLYGEMEKPRFGEVHIRAWTVAGSKKGHMFKAKNSPVVILCLGAEVVLNFIPKGGYDVVEVAASANPQEENDDEGRLGSTSLEQRAGPSQPSEKDGHDQPSLGAATEADVLVVAENTGRAASLTNIERHDSLDAGEVAITPPGSNTQPEAGDDMEVTLDEAEPKPKRGRQKKGKEKKKKTPTPEISMTLVHGDSAILFGDDFECQIIRVGTSILVIGGP